MAPVGALHTWRSLRSGGSRGAVRGLGPVAGVDSGPCWQGTRPAGLQLSRRASGEDGGSKSRSWGQQIPSPAACSALSVRRAEGGLARARQTELTDVPCLKGLQIHAGSGARGRRVEE